MKKLLVAAIAVVVVVLGLALSGVIPIPGQQDTSRPPCDQLPSIAAVSKALEDNTGTVHRLEVLSAEITVQPSKPCTGDATRALIQIRYSSRDDRDKIEALLQRVDGFGVPVELAKH